MPGRNLEKLYLEDSYYHIYNRGVNKESVFCDSQDYAVFLNLLKRHLSHKAVKDKQGREYIWLHNEVKLLAFCLISNHFHLLLYQKTDRGFSKLLKSVTVSYGMYFNRKYKRIGPVFQNCFRASLITKDNYLEHISRYIHLNPSEHEKWQFSSLPYYLGEKSAEWLDPKPILELFDDKKEYKQFIDDYVDYKKMLDEIKEELADTYLQGDTL